MDGRQSERRTHELERGTVILLNVTCFRLDRDKEIDGHSTAHRLNVHADGHVCSACHGQLTDNRGTRTPVFESCFKAMDEACDADGHDKHSFCHSIRKSPRGLNEIIKVENWKTQHCHWAMEDLRH